MKRIVILAVVALGLGALPAYAQEPAPVTLEASRSRLSFGHRVTLSGTVSPAVAGQEVAIQDEQERVRATVRTDEQGRFVATLRPKANSTLRAVTLGQSSETVTVKVRPVLRVKLGRVRLFGRTPIRGTLRPAHEGARVVVTLKRNGIPIAGRSMALVGGERFSGWMYISKPGRIRATAVFKDADHLPARDRSAARSPELPLLGVGSRGVFVRLLEKRLDELGYLLPGVDRRYDFRTSDAVVAFNKVQRRARVGSADEATWRALASPRIAPVRYKKPRFHIEVDQTKQVLYFVKRARVTKIVHVSTGAGGGTHDGAYTFFRDIAGSSGAGLYYPTYFDGLRAIHGWPEVPTYAASHGCVRVPMWTARWIHDHLDLGNRIFIYH